MTTPTESTEPIEDGGPTGPPLATTPVDIMHFPSIEDAQRFLVDVAPVVTKADVYIHIESDVHAPEEGGETPPVE